MSATDETARRRSEVIEEFAHHLEMIERAELACGATPEAARARAAERFGDTERALRQCERVLKGTRPMSANLRSIGVMTWRVAVTLGVCTALLWAYWANVRAVEASSLAYASIVRTGTTAPVQSARGADRAAILRSVWGLESGDVEIRGAVKNPGRFAVNIESPLDLATLIDRAGGTIDNAESILWRQRGDQGEAYVTITNALRFKGDHNTMPAPGSIITVR